MKRILALLVLLGVASIGSAKASRPQDEPQGAKQDMKDAGHETKQAAKKTGTAVGKSSKKVAHESEAGAKKTGSAVEKGTKTAGHESEDAAKKTGNAVETGTKKTAHGVKKGTEKITGKTEPQ
jgi:hypothetical protein